MNAILPRPTGVLCKPDAGQTSNCVTFYESNKKWLAPPTETITKHKTINQLIHFSGCSYALDEFGTLVIEDDDKVKRKLVDREVLYAVPQGNTKLYFILKDSVVFKSAYSWNTVTIFEGEVSEVIAGEAHAFLKTSEGLYYATGANNYTQYAMVHAQTDEETTLLTTLNKLPIKQVYCGGWHCYAKLTDGTFLGWGYNQDGRLGNGGSDTICTPTPLKHHELGIHTLKCGGWHTLGLTHSGDVYVWGANVNNGIGIPGVSFTTTVPTLLLQGLDVINLFADSYSSTSLAQTRSGDVYIWGQLSQSVLGDFSNARIVPSVVEKLKNVHFKYVHLATSGISITLETRSNDFVIKNRDKFTDVSVFLNRQ